MAVITDRHEAMAARILWNATGGRSQFDAQSAETIVRSLDALSPEDRFWATRALDCFTDTHTRLVKVPGHGDVQVTVRPVSRPDAAAADILDSYADRHAYSDQSEDEAHPNFRVDPGRQGPAGEVSVRPGPDGNSRIRVSSDGIFPVDP